MIDLDISLWIELVSMLVLMFLLNAMLYKPIRRLLEEREARMAAIRSDVEKFRRNAEQLLADYSRKLDEARRSGLAEREGRKKEAREEERRLLETSAKETEVRKQQMLTELHAQIGKAREELRAQVENFAAEIAQKLLGRAV
ncbi:ATP synthase F0 subunit B [Dissulfurirhabdus thermomarina]|uniref:ATP synthase subunit b n=1 Tax=Dissulfurirhabdus thermomarina TaxID=1765737 RepID=A0A6N9TLB7_DISTH|nr:ATP synthase F0 subunit B [Dissulfurirhabdus thermomarina]NDY42071.1 ATP synthase F0 subunit B [Dissulfurirhabdus thermomarina]NMX22821.1 ATP synthase F0 subunit B [Dissulfurirhabdus thermomarina]